MSGSRILRLKYSTSRPALPHTAVFTEERDNTAQYRPSFMHSTQRGCASRYFFLAFCHAFPYPLAPALRTSSGCIGLWTSQYLVPYGTSAAQPGCRHGVFGRDGIMCNLLSGGELPFPDSGLSSNSPHILSAEGLFFRYALKYFFQDSHGRSAFPKCPYAETLL